MQNSQQELKVMLQVSRQLELQRARQRDAAARGEERGDALPDAVALDRLRVEADLRRERRLEVVVRRERLAVLVDELEHEVADHPRERGEEAVELVRLGLAPLPLERVRVGARRRGGTAACRRRSLRYT